MFSTLQHSKHSRRNLTLSSTPRPHLIHAVALLVIPCLEKRIRKLQRESKQADKQFWSRRTETQIQAAKESFFFFCQDNDRAHFSFTKTCQKIHHSQLPFTNTHAHTAALFANLGWNAQTLGFLCEELNPSCKKKTNISLTLLLKLFAFKYPFWNKNGVQYLLSKQDSLLSSCPYLQLPFNDIQVLGILNLIYRAKEMTKTATINFHFQVWLKYKNCR